MNGLYRAVASVVLFAGVVPLVRAAVVGPIDPLRFFAGVTETDGTTKIVMHKAVRTRSIGRGEIEPDGSLLLVQRVEDEGRAPYVRRWEIRQTGTGRFQGSMSEATGPIAIEQVGARYRFTFRMKGNLSVEQWLTPLPGGLSASSSITVRKFGLPVASSIATVRKVS